MRKASSILVLAAALGISGCVSIGTALTLKDLVKAGCHFVLADGVAGQLVDTLLPGDQNNPNKLKALAKQVCALVGARGAAGIDSLPTARARAGYGSIGGVTIRGTFE